MFYLFIFESIGTSELILIAVVALMVFGPRKLPDLAKTIAKTMGEFRRQTDEFKKTWEKEVDFELGKMNPESDVNSLLGGFTGSENTFKRETPIRESEMVAPEIKEIEKEDFDKNFPIKEIQVAKQLEAVKKVDNKEDWL